MSWTVAEIPERFAELAQLADEHGYIAAIIGSTVKAGEGRDLDVVMLGRFCEQHRWRELLGKFGGTVVRTFVREDRGNHSYEIERDGKLYHFIFGKF